MLRSVEVHYSYSPTHSPAGGHPHIKAITPSTYNIQKALDAVERSYGLIQWSGSHEDLDYLIHDVENDPLEGPRPSTTLPRARPSSWMPTHFFITSLLISGLGRLAKSSFRESRTK